MSSTSRFGRVYFHAKKHCFLTLPRSWKIQPSGKSVVTFSLERFQTPKKVFASWNGEYSDDLRVGINQKWAVSAGLEEDEEIVFTLVPELVKCFQVTVKPESPEDWQALHLNLTKVQDSLLDQLRVFWKDLVFPFYIHSGFSVSLRVISTNPVFTPLELCQTTEVHLVTLDEIAGNSVSSADNRVKSTEVAMTSTILAPTSSLPESMTVDLSKRSFGARLCGTTQCPQTEVRLNSNIIEKDFVGSLQRNCRASDAENRKTMPESIGVLPDGCFPLKGDTVCFFRVQANSWSNENEIYCPPSLKKRLGLEDCCMVTITVLEDKYEPAEKIILNPIINAVRCPKAKGSLEEMLKKELSQSGPLIVCPGTFLELEEVGFIVNVEKPEWLRPEAKFTAVLGRTLSRHNIENSPVPVPVEKLSEISPPGRGLHKIGGYKAIVSELISSIKNSCGVFADSGQAILLTAAEGVGKTYLTQTVLDYLRESWSIYSKIVQCSGQRGKRTETLVKEWQKTFGEAVLLAPSVIFFDNLDSLCGVPSGHDGSNGADGQYIAKNCRAFIDIVQKARQQPKICLLISAKSWAGLSEILTKTAGLYLFDNVIEMKPPDADERVAIFNVLARDLNMKLDDSALTEIGRRTEGFIGRDMQTLVQKLCVKMIEEELTEPTKDVLDSVMKSIVSTTLQGLRLAERSGAPTDWDSVGGLSDQKRLLQETFLWPTLYPSLMKQCPIRFVSGVLLYGMPGTGKTRLASCLARESKINFISVKGPELLSKFVGASELAVRDLFQRAKSAAPCVIFFDEFDSMAPRRGHDSTGVTDRCVNQLLTLLDGVETEGGVAVLAATSRPELIDPALLRPGRLDRCIECPLPQTAEERKVILKSLSKAVPFDDHCDFDEIAAATEHFSGADLQALLFNAQLAAIQETLRNIGDGDSDGALSTRGDELNFEGIHFSPSIDQGLTKLTRAAFEAMPESDRNELKVLLKPSKEKSQKSDVEAKLRQEHLRTALKETRPSISEAEIIRFGKIYETFRNRGVGPSAKPKPRVTLA